MTMQKEKKYEVTVSFEVEATDAEHAWKMVNSMLDSAKVPTMYQTILDEVIIEEPNHID